MFRNVWRYLRGNFAGPRAMYHNVWRYFKENFTGPHVLFRNVWRFFGEILQGPKPCFAMFGDILVENFRGAQRHVSQCLAIL
jgi:hypothetical protein